MVLYLLPVNSGVSSERMRRQASPLVPVRACAYSGSVLSSNNRMRSTKWSKCLVVMSCVVNENFMTHSRVLHPKRCTTNLNQFRISHDVWCPSTDFVHTNKTLIRKCVVHSPQCVLERFTFKETSPIRAKWRYTAIKGDAMALKVTPWPHNVLIHCRANHRCQKNPLHVREFDEIQSAHFSVLFTLSHFHTKITTDSNALFISTIEWHSLRHSIKLRCMHTAQTLLFNWLYLFTFVETISIIFRASVT